MMKLSLVVLALVAATAVGVECGPEHVDDDAKLQSDPDWKDWTCADSVSYCDAKEYPQYVDTMKACAKTCSFCTPPPPKPGQCADDDACLQGRGAGWAGYTCADSSMYCKDHADDMKCCPVTCGMCPTVTPAPTPPATPTPAPMPPATPTTECPPAPPTSATDPLYDTNGSGGLEKEELQVALSCFKGVMTDMLRSGGLKNTDMYVFEQLDKNKDGKVTEDEIAGGGVGGCQGVTCPDGSCVTAAADCQQGGGGPSEEEMKTIMDLLKGAKCPDTVLTMLQGGGNADFGFLCDAVPAVPMCVTLVEQISGGGFSCGGPTPDASCADDCNEEPSDCDHFQELTTGSGCAADCPPEMIQMFSAHFCNPDGTTAAKSVDASDYVSREKYNTLLGATAGLAGLVVGVAMTATVAFRCSKGSDTSTRRRDDRTVDMEMTEA